MFIPNYYNNKLNLNLMFIIFNFKNGDWGLGIGDRKSVV